MQNSAQSESVNYENKEEKPCGIVAYESEKKPFERNINTVDRKKLFLKKIKMKIGWVISIITTYAHQFFILVCNVMARLMIYDDAFY